MDLFRYQSQIDVQVRERIQESGAVGRRFGRFHGLQPGQLFGEFSALFTEGGVFASDSVAEFLLLLRIGRAGQLIVCEAVGESVDQAGLTLTDGRDGVLQRGTFRSNAVAAGLIREASAFECSGEVAAPVGAEDSRGEETGDAREQDLFSNPQALGVLSEPRLVPVFIRIELTGIVRNLVASLAEHASITDLPGDKRPQDVGALGRRVGVGSGRRA